MNKKNRKTFSGMVMLHDSSWASIDEMISWIDKLVNKAEADMSNKYRGRKDRPTQREAMFWDRFPELLMDDPEDKDNELIELLRGTAQDYFKRRRMIKVYIASPYTKGDVAVNVKAQLDVANELIELGYAPFVPLYSHFQHMAHPRPYMDWAKLDMEWLKKCDCLLRLPGDSSGADKEVEWAQEHGMDVVHSINELERLKKVYIEW